MLATYVCLACGTQFQEKYDFCSNCGAFKLLSPIAHRPANQFWRTTEIVSASSLIKRAADSFESRSYPIPFGSRSLVALYGPPGGGKSTMLLKLLDGLDGDTLFVSLEEGLGETLVSKLRHLEIVNDRLQITYVREVGDLDELLGARKFSAIALDSLSVSTLSVDDLRRITVDLEIPAFFSLHVRKDGAPAGVMSTLHAADVVLEVCDLKWRVEKSRFGTTQEGTV